MNGEELVQEPIKDKRNSNQLSANKSITNKQSSDSKKLASPNRPTIKDANNSSSPVRGPTTLGDNDIDISPLMGKTIEFTKNTNDEGSPILEDDEEKDGSVVEDDGDLDATA